MNIFHIYVGASGSIFNSVPLSPKSAVVDYFYQNGVLRNYVEVTGSAVPK